MPVLQENTKTSMLMVAAAGFAYIGFSAALIAYNRILMLPGMFPYPAALGLLHTTFGTCMATALFLVRPQLFTSLAGPDKKVHVNLRMMQTVILPIAVLFSLQIILSNQALAFSDPAFLQMVKEFNVVLVYVFSVAVALEAFKWRQMQLICFIVFSTWMTVKGEIRFVLLGFSLQFLSCFIESGKITLQGLLLSSAGKGLDALSYMLLVMPACATIFSLVVMSLSLAAPGQQILPMPNASEWIRMRWHLLGNSCTALMLNASMVIFINCSSAVSFVLAGILKDVCIVATGVIFMGHESSTLQVTGFVLQVTLVIIWSLLRIFPKEFEDGYISGMQTILIGKHEKVEGEERRLV